jgi:protein-L-isoaspartate(D-aspartate) O-methyltransferase
MNNQNLVNLLAAAGVLTNSSQQAAFTKIDRVNFVLPAYQNEAYLNIALPLFNKQTISQPLTVAFMLNLLKPQAGEKILEIGFGSGYQTALLAELVGPTGLVYALEIDPEIFAFGRGNLAKYPQLSNRIKLFCQNGELGLPAQAKHGFTKIIVAAEIETMPAAWHQQLKVGGYLVYPYKHSLWREIKINQDDFSVEKYPGFIFVPLRH